jgi:hypothetical protein
MHDFILKMYNTIFYIILLIIYEMKWNLRTQLLILRGFSFLNSV